MKSKEEILVFLIRNAVPDKFLPVKAPRVEGSPPVYPLYDLLLRLSGVTRYTVELQKFEEFIGEKYSFEKHMRPLHEEGTLLFQVAEPGSFYDTSEYRKVFDGTNGMVRNVDANISYIAFRIRTYENSFLDEFRRIQENAEELGLKERRPLRFKEQD